MIVGFDIGTTGLKALLFDHTSGAVVAEAATAYGMARPRPGWAEQDAATWLAALDQCARELWQAHPDAEPVAIGLTSQVNTHLFVDADMRPLRPAITWQDQRCADIAEELGPGVDPSFSLARLEWVRRHEPALAERARWLLLPKDYVVARLTGAVCTDPISSIALVDDDGTYKESAMTMVSGAAELLPRIAPFDSAAGVSNGALGLPAGLPVSVGTMDMWASMYGAGVVAPGEAVQISGTSETVGVMSDRPGHRRGIVSFPPVRGRYLHAGPTQSGGDALRWAAELLGLSIDEALAVAGEAAAAPQNLLFLPHLAGERAPVWNPDARGVWLGLSNDTTPGHLVLGVLEGVAFAARHLREECALAAGVEPECLRLSGGATRSDLWNRIKAAAHGMPVDVASTTASGALGAALMAGVAAGLEPDLEAWAARAATVRTTVDPDPAMAPRLDRLYGLYRETYRQLVGVFGDLAGS